MNHLLVIHHDADLYGADKSLLRTLRGLKGSEMVPIVALPCQGPLADILRAEGFEIHLGPVGKLTHRLMRPLAWPSMLRNMLASVRFISHIVAGRKVSLVYTNSLAAPGGALWAILHRVPRLWHAREIVVVPKVAGRAFPLMLRLLGGWCVCNSNATRQWIVSEQASLGKRSSVIWNGLEEVASPGKEDIAAFRERLGIRPDQVLVTLVGRINRWKGQDVLIDAAARLRQQGAKAVRYLIVGDVADGQHHFRETMLERIRELGLGDLVLWHPFSAEIDLVWAASDVAVVPSTEPEPFGRVAIEAMAHGLPVIASANGGLLEIVEQQRTGLLVAPGSAGELADAISRLVESPGLRKAWGEAGRVRQRALFTQAEHDRKLLALMRQVCGGSK